jgi:hypothetical protein
MKNELTSGKIIVDVWTIEYRVWDGTKIMVDKSKNNLEGLRCIEYTSSERDSNSQR